MPDSQSGQAEVAVRAGYDRWAAVYDHDGNPLQALEEPFMRNALVEVRGRSVLELGCGTGRHTAWLVQGGADVTALDFSEGMLAKARARRGVAAVRFLVHDLGQPLPFADNEFDIAVSGLVLEHLRDLNLFFGEARRVLKPGGRAIISAMHPAMMLRGTQAQFTDPGSGELIRPGSFPHQISDYAMSAIRAGFQLEHLTEHVVDEVLAQTHARATKYLGWPMLMMMKLQKA